MKPQDVDYILVNRIINKKLQLILFFFICLQNLYNTENYRIIYNQIVTRVFKFNRHSGARSNHVPLRDIVHSFNIGQGIRDPPDARVSLYVYGRLRL